MKNVKRHLDLSAKFIQMGQALMDEGRDSEDSTISLVGTNLIFLGGIILSENDVKKFSELVSMFSAKKLLDDMVSLDSDEYKRIGERGNSETYDELIARLKKLKDEGDDKEDNNEK